MINESSKTSQLSAINAAKQFHKPDVSQTSALPALQVLSDYCQIYSKSILPPLLRFKVLREKLHLA